MLPFLYANVAQKYRQHQQQTLKRQQTQRFGPAATVQFLWGLGELHHPLAAKTRFSSTAERDSTDTDTVYLSPEHSQIIKFRPEYKSMCVVVSVLHR